MKIRFPSHRLFKRRLSFKKCLKRNLKIPVNLNPKKGQLRQQSLLEVDVSATAWLLMMFSDMSSLDNLHIIVMHNRKNRTLRQDKPVVKETKVYTKIALKALSVSIKKKTLASIVAMLMAHIEAETLNKNTMQSHQRELSRYINSLRVPKRWWDS